MPKIEVHCKLYKFSIEINCELLLNKNLSHLQSIELLRLKMQKMGNCKSKEMSGNIMIPFMEIPPFT